MSIVCLELLTFGLGHLVRAADLLGERLVLVTRDPSFYTYELDRLPQGRSTWSRPTPSTRTGWPR